MNIRCFASALFAVAFLVSAASGQTYLVINDPSTETPITKLNASEEVIVKRDALPKVRTKLADGLCEEEFDASGVIKGSFSKANAKQTLVFYQFCQTGNGLGQVGLILIEGGKVVRSYTADGGWSVGIVALPDINENGLDEFALHYSGGMHQGEGGTGVDIMEFTANGLKGLGWFQADAFFAEADSIGWKVSVKKGKVPVFFREKYTKRDEGNWRRSGKSTRFSLTKAYSKFTAVKRL